MSVTIIRSKKRKTASYSEEHPLSAIYFWFDSSGSGKGQRLRGLKFKSKS